MKFKIDLHVHSLHSGDNDSDPEETIVNAVNRGLQGIAFTEHYSFEASAPVERYRDKYRHALLILRGVEYSTAEGHCLVFGVDTDALSDTVRSAPARELMQLVQESDGVVVPSHPYRPGNSLGEGIRKLHGIIAVEGYNGANMHAYNKQAIEAAEALHLPYTGGSDAHDPSEVGSCYTEFDDEVTYENFIDLLKAGRYRGVDTRKISRFELP